MPLITESPVNEKEAWSSRIKSIKTGDDSKLFNDMAQGVDYAFTQLPDHKRKQMRGLDGQHDMTRRIYNTKSLAAVYGKKYEEVALNFDQYSHDFSTNTLKLSDKVDDSRLYQGINKWRGDMVQKDDQRKVFTASIYEAAVPHVLAGGTSSEFILDRVSGMASDGVSRGESRRMSLTVLRDLEKKIGPVRKLAQSTIDSMKVATGVDEGEGSGSSDEYEVENKAWGVKGKVNVPRPDKDIDNILAQVSQLPEDQQQAYIWVVDKMLQSQGEEYEGLRNSLIRKFEKGFKDGVEAAGELGREFFEMATHQAATGEVRSKSKINPEMANRHTLNHKVRNWKSTVAQVDSDAIGFFNEDWNKATGEMSESMGRMPLLAMPYIGLPATAAAYARENYEEMKEAHPDIDETTAWWLSIPMGATRSKLEKVGMKGMFKGFPVIERAFQKAVNASPKLANLVTGKVSGAMATGVRRVAGITAYETFQEHVDQGVGVFYQDIWHQMGGNVPKPSQERIKKVFTFDPQIARVSFLMGLTGGGGAVGLEAVGMKESANFLASEDMLMAAGADPQTAADVAKIQRREGTFKAQKKLEAFVEQVTPEQLEANREAAVKSGAVKRMQIQQLEDQKKNGKTQKDKDMAEAQLNFIDFEAKHMAQVEQDGDYYNLVYPESENRPNEPFESQEEAQAAKVAYDMDTISLANGELVQSAENIEAVREAAQHMEAAHEDSKIEIKTEKNRTVEQAINEGAASMENMLERANIYAMENGISQEMSMKQIRQMQILGEVKLRQEARGFVAKIYKGGNIATVFEEGSEGYIRDLIDNDVVDMDFLKFHLGQYEQDTNEQLAKDAENMTDQEAIEGFSRLARAHIWNNKDNSVLSPHLAKLIDVLRAFFRSVFKTAENLTALKKDGKLDQDFEKHLDRAVGLNEDAILENERRRYERELMEEASDPDTELQKAIKGKLPRPSDMKKGDVGYGEIKDLFDHFKRESKNSQTKDGKARVVSTGASALFAVKGSKIDLDMLRESLNELGFDFDTPAEMLEALDDSLRGMKQFPTVDRGAVNDVEQGRTFSFAMPTDPVMEKLNALMRDPDKRMAMYKIMQVRLEAVRKGIDERLLKKIVANENYNSSKADALESLAMLQAIAAVLPVEVRSQLGGWRKIASYATRDGVERYLVNRLDKVDKLLEKHLSKETRANIDDLFDRARPKKGKMEKVGKGKLTPDVHTELENIEKVINMSDDKLADEEGRVSDAIGKLNMKEADTAQEQDKVDAKIFELEKQQIRIMAFGKVKSKDDPMSSAGLAEVYEQLDNMVGQGRIDWAIHLLKRKENRDNQANQTLQDISGGKVTPAPDSAEFKKKTEKDKKQLFRTFLKDNHAHNISFEHLLNWISRNSDSAAFESYINRQFGERVHKATHGEAQAVAVQTVELEHKIAELFGIDIQKTGWHGKVVDRIAKLAERKDQEFVRHEDIERAEIKMPRAVAEDVAEGRTDTLENGGLETQLNEVEIQRIKDNLEAHPRAKSIQIVRVKRNQATPQYLSEDEMMFLTMMHKQVGLRDAMEYHGYSPDLMESMEESLSDEAKALRAWMWAKYDGNYAYFNNTFKELFGLNLPKVKDYAPAKSYHRGKHAQEMIDAGQSRMSTTPGMAIDRIQHKATPRNDVGAIQTYIHHVQATEHFVHWAELVGDMRSVFNRKEVREAIIYHHGQDVYQVIADRIEMFAAGGNANATVMRKIDKLRKNFTVAKLAYNWGVALKQLTSLPAYAYDMGVADYIKYQSEFFKNPIDNVKFMAGLDYTKERWSSGYDRDVSLVLNQIDKQSKLGKVAHLGMKFGQTGDIIPVMVGGYAAYRNGYEKSKARSPKAKDSVHVDRGTLAFEMATDRAQQSGHLKDQSDYALGGSLARVLTMFTTSPRQYMSNSVGAFIDMEAGREGGKARFAKHMFISHVILPSLFHFVSVGVRNAFKDDADDEEYLGKGWLASMALGPLSGYFLLGQGLSAMASGFAYKLPVLETFYELGKGVKGAGDMVTATMDDDEEIEPGDVIKTLDAIATSMSMWRGEGALLYDIVKGRAKSFGLDKGDLERLTMNEVDGKVHDLGKEWNKAQKEHTKDKKNPGDKSYLDARYNYLAEKYQEVKDRHPHAWGDIAEELKEKNKLPAGIEDQMD